MKVTLLRVDSRLVHGQVIEAWLPYVEVASIFVVDDAVVMNPVLKEVMTLAVPSNIEVFFCSVEEFVSGGFTGMGDAQGTLVLCRNLRVAEKLVKACKDIRKVNLGNLQAGPGKKCVGPTIYLDGEDREIIERIRQRGVEVDARAVPGDVDLFGSF